MATEILTNGKRRALWIGLICLLPLVVILPKDGIASSAARKEDVLCHAEYVVLGTVLSISQNDCRLTPPEQRKSAFCLPMTGINLQIEVNQILGAKEKTFLLLNPSGVDVGQSVEVYSSLVNSPPFVIEESGGRIGVVPPTGTSVSDKFLSDLFLGKQFIFSISVHRGRYASVSDGKAVSIIEDYQPPPPYHTGIWLMRNKEWIVKLLETGNGESCSQTYIETWP